MGELRYSFTIVDLGTGWRSVSCPRGFRSGERAPGIYWIKGWVGPRAVLKATEKIKVLALPGIAPRASIS
jgi:hypothetical protein